MTEIKSYLLEICPEVSPDLFTGPVFLTGQAPLQPNTEAFCLQGKASYLCVCTPNNTAPGEPASLAEDCLPIERSADGTPAGVDVTSSPAVPLTH